MRILFVSEASSHMLGGVTTELRQLVTGLKQRGHEIGLASEAPVAGADAAHFRLDMPRSAQTLEQLRACVDAFDPDVVHVMFAFSQGAIDFARVLGPRPWILTCHSVPPSEWTVGYLHRHERLHYWARDLRYSKQSWLATRLYAGRLPPRVIVHSGLIKEAVARRRYPNERIALIPFGVDPFERAPNPHVMGTDPRLMTIAGIKHTKGFHDFIAAMPAVRRRHPGACYTIIGEVRDPGYLDFLKKQVVDLQLSDHVRFVISASAAAVSQAFDDTDVFVQPSHEEGFCLSYMEAAARVPRLVGTRTGAIPEMSSDDSGAITVPVRDPGALAAAVLTLIDRPLPPGLVASRRDRLSARFPWSAYLDRHEALYADVARRNDRHAPPST